MKEKIKRIFTTIQHILMPLCARNSFLAGLYYTFFSKKFHREHKAVMSGCLAYKKNNGKVDPYELRRNIHRLEKGIVMRPRRNVFGLAYIERTVELFIKQKNLGHKCEWPQDVLTAFFEITDDVSELKHARNRFTQSLENDIRKPSKIPSLRGQMTSPINFNDFEKLCLQRRSVRWFISTKPERKQLDKAFILAGLSPSACNRQPYRFIVVDEEPLLGKVSKLPGGTAGFAHNFPCIVAVVGDLSAYQGEHDRHVIYIDASLASMTFMYALETIGLSSCAINWPDLEFRERQSQALLSLKNYERVIMFIAVGKADPSGQIPYSDKKPLNETRNYLV